MTDAPWTPKHFEALAERAHRGEAPSVRTRDLLEWFSITRRTARAVSYLEQVFARTQVRCVPAVRDAMPGELLVFSSLRPEPPRVAAPAPPARAPEASDEPSLELPTFLAEYEARLDVQTDLAQRLGTYHLLVEDTLAYLCFALLALYRHPATQHDAPGLAQRAEALVAETVKPQPLSFGAWHGLARALSLLTPLADPLVVAARALGTAKPPSPLAAGALDAVVQLRNRMAHGAAPSDDELRSLEGPHELLWRALRGALAPLLRAELCWVQALQGFDADGALRYALRVLRGGRHGRRRELVTATRIEPGWSVLLRPDAPPLPLIPGLFCEEDRSTSTVRTFLCRTVSLAPGDTVRAVERPGGAQRTVPLPRS